MQREISSRSSSSRYSASASSNCPFASCNAPRRDEKVAAPASAAACSAGSPPSRRSPVRTPSGPRRGGRGRARTTVVRPRAASRRRFPPRRPPSSPRCGGSPAPRRAAHTPSPRHRRSRGCRRRPARRAGGSARRAPAIAPPRLRRSRSMRVLADRLEHREARLAVAPRSADEALVDERGEASSTSSPSLAADRLGRLERPAAGEDRRAARRALRRRLGEELVAPVERRAQRPLAVRQVARAADQHIERAARAAARAPPAGELRIRAAASSIASGRPSSRAQTARRVGVVSVEREPGIDCRGASAKRRTASFATELLELGRARCRRPGAAEPGTRARPATRSGARLVASTRRRGAAPAARATSRALRRELLEVVEDEQHATGRAGAEHGLACASSFRQPRACASAGTTSSGSRTRDEVDERRAVPRAPARAAPRRRARAASCPSRRGP